MIKLEEELTPYKKKAKKKPPKKSNHKHVFKDCVFEFKRKKFDPTYGQVEIDGVRIGGYCVICGKIGPRVAEWMVWETINPHSKIGRFVYTDAAKRELDPATRTLPTFHLDNYLSQKFVTLEEE